MYFTSPRFIQEVDMYYCPCDKKHRFDKVLNIKVCLRKNADAGTGKTLRDVDTGTWVYCEGSIQLGWRECSMTSWRLDNPWNETPSSCITCESGWYWGMSSLSGSCFQQSVISYIIFIILTPDWRYMSWVLSSVLPKVFVNLSEKASVQNYLLRLNTCCSRPCQLLKGKLQTGKWEKRFMYCDWLLQEFFRVWDQWLPAEVCEEHKEMWVQDKLKRNATPTLPVSALPECCQRRRLEDKRTPGLFKEEWRGDGIIALCSKTYLGFQNDRPERTSSAPKVCPKGWIHCARSNL